MHLALRCVVAGTSAITNGRLLSSGLPVGVQILNKFTSCVHCQLSVAAGMKEGWGSRVLTNTLFIHISYISIHLCHLLRKIEQKDIKFKDYKKIHFF